ncbi:TPA: DUF2339 domain-containing protein [Providencia alcalifaciens]
MDTWILLGLVLIALVIVAPVLAIIAINRTGRMQYQIHQLNQKITSLEAKIAHGNGGGPVSALNTMDDNDALTSVEVQCNASQLEHFEPEDNKNDVPETPIQDAQPLFQPMSVSSHKQPDTVHPVSINPNRFDKTRPSQASSEQNELESRSIFAHFFSWLVTGNPLAKIGILLLFLGVAYLLNYSVQNEIISPELRLVFSAAGCLVLLCVGWWLRKKKALFGLILQGGAIGCLYITVFAGFKLYAMIPYGFAFVAMLIICSASIALALLQRTISLAVLASLGGYLAPILLSSGGGSHIVLFSYYLMLSIGILVISFWQAWRPLNLVGMFMTYGVAVLWGMEHYNYDYYLSCQLFIIANLIVFNVLTQLFALRFEHSKQLVVDNTLLFFPPLMSISLQFAISGGIGLLPAFISLLIGLLYLIASIRLHKRFSSVGKNMALGNIIIGASFVTLAVPLALSFEWTTIVWSLQGFAMLWFALNQGHKKLAMTSCLLIAISALMILSDYPYYYWSDNVIYMMPSLIAVCFFAGGLFHVRHKETRYFTVLSYLFLFLGLLVWFAWVPEFTSMLSWNSEVESLIILALVLISAWCWRLGGQKINWIPLVLCQFLLWAVAYYYLALDFIDANNPMGRGEGSLIWPVILGSSVLFVMHAYRTQNLYIRRGMHVANLWLIIGFVATQVHWFVVNLPWGMHELGYFIYIMSMTLLVLVLYWLQHNKFVPMRRKGLLYWYSILPLMAVLVVLSSWSNLEDGKLTFWSYVPLVNPLDEAGLFSIAALLLMRKGFMEKLRKVTPLETGVLNGLMVVIIGLTLLWYNGIILRATADFANITWNRYILFDSRLVQTVLSISWGIAALVCMVIAAVKKSRVWWFGGAAIFVCVIAKLFLIDVYGQDGISRAVSFIAVAVLILVVGYFSPLPPKHKMDIEIQEK